MKKCMLVILITLVLALSACDPTANSERIFVLEEDSDIIEIHTVWDDPGAYLEYGNMIVYVETVDTVDTTTLGTYQVEYSVTNKEIVYSGTRTVTVVDTTIPTLLLIVGTDTVKVGNSWTDAGSTASDNSLEELTIIVSGTVDTATVGTYDITYSAMDSSGNEVSVIRVVTITE